MPAARYAFGVKKEKHAKRKSTAIRNSKIGNQGAVFILQNIGKSAADRFVSQTAERAVRNGDNMVAVCDNGGASQDFSRRLGKFLREIRHIPDRRIFSKYNLTFPVSKDFNGITFTDMQSSIPVCNGVSTDFLVITPLATLSILRYFSV